ncbi:hypothetical protein VCHENC02_4730, partial [Vibrio harveyi]
MCTIL